MHLPGSYGDSCQGGGLPVPSPGLRSVDCSPGLPSGFRSLVRVGSRLRDSSSEVTGRLAASRFFGTGSQTVSPVPPLSFSLPQVSDIRVEVESGPLADCQIPGHDLRY